MDKRLAGIILAVIGGAGLVMALYSILQAIYVLYVNTDYNGDGTALILPVIAWGLPGFILILAGLRLKNREGSF